MKAFENSPAARKQAALLSIPCHTRRHHQHPHPNTAVKGYRDNQSANSSPPWGFWTLLWKTLCHPDWQRTWPLWGWEGFTNPGGGVNHKDVLDYIFRLLCAQITSQYSQKFVVTTDVIRLHRVMRLKSRIFTFFHVLTFRSTSDAGEKTLNQHVSFRVSVLV